MKKKRSGFITFLYILGAAIVLFGLIQLVPYGKTHVNPPIVKEPNWDSPETRAIAKTACFDCHSNESTYPWYSSIAPTSWLVQRDIDEARGVFNFSDWGNHPGELDELAEVIQSGKMPPLQYTLIHTDARLNQAQREQLVKGLEASLK